MNAERRTHWAQPAIRIVVLLVALDALAYFALNRPLARLVAQEQQRFSAVRLQWLREKTRLAYLEKRDAALPGEDRQLRGFLEQHVPERREGFSRAALLINRLTQQSGVELAGISYTLDKSKGEPFEHLGVKVQLQGPFTGLLQFEHALETASDFIVVRGFKFEGSQNGLLGLNLNADLYLMP
ncbi:MAG: hypothetical protein ACRD1N_07930 [Terriglobia bacterium]